MGQIKQHLEEAQLGKLRWLPKAVCLSCLQKISGLLQVVLYSQMNNRDNFQLQGAVLLRLSKYIYHQGCEMSMTLLS